jgi:endonuclease-8
MPEGDTIHRAARTLDLALRGQPVASFESVFPQLNRRDEDAPVQGRVVELVVSAGKHLLMHFSGDLTLRTHMRMSGSWHIYRPGERWWKPRASRMRSSARRRGSTAIPPSAGWDRIRSGRSGTSPTSLRG